MPRHSHSVAIILLLLPDAAPKKRRPNKFHILIYDKIRSHNSWIYFIDFLVKLSPVDLNFDRTSYSRYCVHRVPESCWASYRQIQSAFGWCASAAMEKKRHRPRVRDIWYAIQAKRLRLTAAHCLRDETYIAALHLLLLFIVSRIQFACAFAVSFRIRRSNWDRLIWQRNNRKICMNMNL